MDTLGKRIRDRRTEIGLTQRDIGAALGRSAGAVTQWELDTTKPNGQNLIKLSKLLQCDPEWLLTGREDLKGADFHESFMFPRAKSGLKIPLLQWDNVKFDHLDKKDCTDYFLTTAAVSNIAFAVTTKKFGQISTNSLVLPSNSILVIETETLDLPQMVGGMVLIHSRNAPEATIKTLMFDGEKYQLLPTSPQLPAIELTKNIKIIGFIKQIVIDF